MEKYIFTDAHFEQLKAAKLKNHRLTIGQFSKCIGRSPQTVSGAIKASRHLDAVHALFPMMKITQKRAQERVKNKGGGLLCNAHPVIARAMTMRWAA